MSAQNWFGFGVLLFILGSFMLMISRLPDLLTGWAQSFGAPEEKAGVRRSVATEVGAVSEPGTLAKWMRITGLCGAILCAIASLMLVATSLFG